MTTDIAKNGNRRSVRLFFAVQPSRKTQKELGHVAKKLALTWGGRAIKPENIHLTLVFLGETDVDRIDILRTAATDISAEAETFTLTFRRTSFWKYNQIIYAQAETDPPELLALVESLKNALHNIGIAFDNRAFKPHITLVRKAAHHIPADLQNPIVWPVKQWHLMLSKRTDQGMRYITVGCWQLR